MKYFIAAIAAAVMAGQPASGATGDRIEGKLEGIEISGTVTLEETESGAVLMKIDAEGVPPGEHGIHIHEIGKCDAADGFKSAGDHVAGGLKHGVRTAGGPHPGDLPNAHVGADGKLHAEYFIRDFSLGTKGSTHLLDKDGAALVIHAGADDYQTQSSGNSGDRIACAVLKSAR